MSKEEILQMHSAKHVKIYMLSRLGLSKKEVASALGTNVGHVYNVLKDYAANPEKADKVPQNGVQ